jgi:adenylate cyclase
LEGSVQKEGQRVRITAQLVDAIKGNHLWAERYDRDMKGFFDLLDEITKEIGVALQVQLTWGDYARYHSSTDNFEAWGLFNEAYGLYLRAISERKREDNVRARVLLEKAFKLDPEYARALLVNGWTHLSDVLFGWSKSPQESIERAIELAKKARTIDESQVGLHALWSMIYLTKGQYERAIKEAEKAIAQDPNWSIGYISLGMALFDFGRFEEVIPAIKTSMRLHGPYFPANLLQFLAAAYSMAGHYEKAISTYKKYFDRCKAESCLKIWHLGLAVTYIWIGQEEEARNHAAEVLMIDPKFSLEDYAKLFRFKNQADTDRVIDALRKAGLK